MHDSNPLVGVQEQNAIRFERPSNLIARGLVDLEPAFGLEALERGQRYPGLIRKLLLCPAKKRARGPRLSGGDHADHLPSGPARTPELRLL